jgi:hypothetical protein
MARSRRKAQAPDRPRAVVNGHVLDARQERIFRLANDEVDSGEFPLVRRGLAALAALEAELAERQAASAVEQGMADTLARERARGEVVDVAADGHGARRLRIRTRDGLETLAHTGAIDVTRHRAGLLYRNLYEAADPERDLKSQLAGLGRPDGSGAPPGRVEVWAERRARVAGALARLEAKVRVADRNDHAVRALREVAGHARCVSHLVRGGGAQARYRGALILALDVCAEHFGLR